MGAPLNRRVVPAVGALTRTIMLTDYDSGDSFCMDERFHLLTVNTLLKSQAMSLPFQQLCQAEYQATPLRLFHLWLLAQCLAFLYLRVPQTKFRVIQAPVRQPFPLKLPATLQVVDVARCLRSSRTENLAHHQHRARLVSYRTNQAPYHL